MRPTRSARTFLRDVLSAPAPSDPVGDATACNAARRRALRALGCGAAALGLSLAGLRGAPAAAAPAAASPPAPADARTLVLHNTHTLETVRAEVCRDGAWCTDGLAAIAQVLRDHRTGDVHAMDRDLLVLLHDLAARCEREAEFEVISGYRSPRTNASLHRRSSGVATKSLHMEGRAIDVRLVGCDLRDLRDAALAMQRGGVGYYSASRFVHVDTGRVRTWAG